MEQSRYEKYRDYYIKYNETYKRSVHGYIVKMYSNIKLRLKLKPTYEGMGTDLSRERLEEFLLKNNFVEVFQRYLDSGSKMSLAPSVDRIDNSRGYFMDNIRLTTHGENASKGSKYEQKNHRGRKRKDK